MLDITYAGALLAGVLSFFSPCVLPLVPGYLGYLGSLQGSDADTASTVVRAKLVLSAVFFAAGFITVFLALGLGAHLIQELAFVGRNLKLFQQIGGVLIILLGVHFLGLFRLGILDRELRYMPNFRKGGVLTSYIVGLAFGFGWTPCVGPVLATIFLVVSTGDIGAGFLVAYGLGIGIPFVVVALFMDVFIKKFASMRRAMHLSKIILGVLMVLTGGLMATGYLNEIGLWLFRNLGTLG